MTESVNLQVNPTVPTDLDFAWYEEIRTVLVGNTVGSARRVLDVGCGPGRVLLALAAQIGNGVGVDIDRGQLALAESARNKRQITNVSFQNANALSTRFGSFR